MLLAVMQWLPTKGIDYLVAAFTELARRHPDLRLTAAGTLKGADEVCAAFPADVRDRVSVIPTFGDKTLPAVMKAADIFVHPSVYEAFGRAVTEAMSSGLPIIVTRTGVAMDYLRDGIDAAIVPVGDAPALVSAIEPMLDDAAMRRRLGESAQARAASLSERASVDALASMLEALVARP
jgi:phosphatidylinositol alpha-mannosyltransferase